MCRACLVVYFSGPGVDSKAARSIRILIAWFCQSSHDALRLCHIAPKSHNLPLLWWLCWLPKPWLEPLQFSSLLQLYLWHHRCLQLLHLCSWWLLNIPCLCTKPWQLLGLTTYLGSTLISVRKLYALYVLCSYVVGFPLSASSVFTSIKVKYCIGKMMSIILTK